MNSAEFLRQLASEGGAIVRSDECSHIEIASAQATGRFYFDEETDQGYVLRRPRWLSSRESAYKQYILNGDEDYQQAQYGGR